MARAHGDSEIGNRHPIENFSYADAAARTGAAGLVAGDVGKVAYQIDTGAYWRLTDDSPVTWVQIGGTGVSGTITTEEGDVVESATTGVIDFDDSDFNVSVSPAGEANVSLNYGAGAGQPAEGNHTHAGGGSDGRPVPGWAAGRYYGTRESVGAVGDNNSAMTAHRLYYTPVFVPRDNTADRIAVWVTTGVALSVVRLGVYAADPDSGLPTSLILDAGTVDSSSNGAKEITIAEALDGGVWYWLASSSGHGPTVRMTTISGNPIGILGLASITATTAALAAHETVADGAAALPASVGALTIPSTSSPLVYLRAGA
jgi:hypothetical protein